MQRNPDIERVRGLATTRLLTPTTDSPPELARWNEDAEQAVLSACLMDSLAVAEARTFLTPAAFFSTQHSKLYEAIIGLADDGVAIDPVTLAARLEMMGVLKECGDKDYIGFLIDAVPTAANVIYHSKIVADHAFRRALLDAVSPVERQMAAGSTTDDVRVRLMERLESIGTHAPTITANRFLLRDDAEIENLPTAQWLIDGLLPEDAIVSVVGPSGSFKSFLTLDWCYHVRTGLDWHGLRTTAGDVVYMAGEGANGIARRSTAWKKLNGLTGTLGVHFLTNGLNLNDVADVGRIIRAIEVKRITPRLIVIDTLARFLVGDENTAKDMGSFIRAADTLRQRFRCTVVIVHHSGKDLMKGGRGSNSLNCGVDTEIKVERPEGESSVTLTVSKQKDGPDGAKYTLEAVNIAQSLALKPSKPYGGKLAGKTLSCLLVLSEQDEGNGLKYGEWLKATDEAKGTFDKSRKWLKASGYVKIEKAHYSVSDSGRMAILSTRSTAGSELVYSPPVTVSTLRGVYSTPGIDQTSRLNLLPPDRA